MKPNRKIVKELIQGLQECKARYNYVFEDYVSHLKHADSVDRVMELKQNLLIDYLQNFPLGMFECYFCLEEMDDEESDDCSKCPYGTIHGICIAEKNNNDYGKIYLQKKNLLRAVRKFYYNNEHYDLELDEEIIDFLVYNAKSISNKILLLFDFVIGEIKKAKSVEWIMKIKKQLLLDLVNYLPLGTNSCYFCLLHSNCISCEYAKHHKICTEKNSDYKKIRNAQDNLYNTIKDNYYRDGEKYEQR